MKIELIQERRGWEAIKQEWDDLLFSRSQHHNPFLTFEWLHSWWEVFGHGKRLRIVATRDRDRLTGLAPMMTSWRTGFRVCEFIGTGRSDYLGFILEKETMEESMDLMLRFILTKVGWDLLYIRDYPDSVEELVRTARQEGLGHLMAQGDMAPFLQMTGSWDGYLAGKSHKHRANIKRLLKNVERDSDIQVECIRRFSEELLGEMSEVEARSWKNEAGDPRLAGNGREFYRNFLRRFAERDWLEIWTFRHKGKLLAYNVNLVIGKGTYFYNGSFDKDFGRHTKHSVGTATTAFAIRHAFGMGMEVFDFLRGDEPYKKLWTNGANGLTYIGIYRRRPYSFLAFLIHYWLGLRLRRYPPVLRVLRRFRQG